MKYLFLLLLAFAVTSFAQVDSLDRMVLRNNRVLEGKVVKITSTTVQFKESLTNVLYEYQKGEIKDLRLSNGTTLSFSDQPQGQTNQSDVTGSAPGGNQPSSTQAPSNTAGSNVTQGSNATGQSSTPGATGSNNTAASGGRNTNNTSNRNVDTTKQTNPQPATNNNPGGLSTPALLLLAAGGVIVLLLLGRAIF